MRVLDYPAKVNRAILRPHSMLITLITAVSEDGFISRDKGIPWHLPADIAHFREYTAGKYLLLGRTTAGEMQGWFRPGHKPIVLTRHPNELPAGMVAASSMEDALALAGDTEELVVCGGAAIYELALPWAHRMLLTHVKTQLGSGKRFPDFRPEDWTATTLSTHAADHEHAHAFQIVRYQRAQPPWTLEPPEAA